MPRHLPQRATGEIASLRLRGGVWATLGILCAAASSGDSPAVAPGRYLAAAGDCISCHTRPGGAPFAGGLAFETPFGTIYSSNITPDAQTGIGRWSAGDLRRAMHEGIARDGSHLFPAFPYTSFTRVSDADIAAIYAYLRTVPAVRYTPPRNGMLFSMRWPMALWKSLHFEPGRFATDAAKPPEWNRGAYLVEGLGHCGACHTPRNWLYAEQAARAFQGGALQAPVSKDKQRRWSAIDLTSSPQGLGPWSIADLTQYFQTGVSPRAGAFGPMNEVIVNSLRLLAPEDLRAMAVYLKGLPGRAYEGEAVSPQRASTGAPIYKARCEKCHGRSGRGGFFSGPPVAGSAVVQAEDPASLINIIIYGPETPREISYGAWETMPSYGDVLDDAQIQALGEIRPVGPHLRLGVTAGNHVLESPLRLGRGHRQHLQVHGEIVGRRLLREDHADGAHLLTHRLHDMRAIVDDILVVRAAHRRSAREDTENKQGAVLVHVNSSAACAPRIAMALLVHRPAHDHAVATGRPPGILREERAAAAGLVRHGGQARIVEQSGGALH